MYELAIVFLVAIAFGVLYKYSHFFMLVALILGCLYIVFSYEPNDNSMGDIKEKIETDVKPRAKKAWKGILNED